MAEDMYDCPRCGATVIAVQGDCKHCGWERGQTETVVEQSSFVKKVQEKLDESQRARPSKKSMKRMTVGELRRALSEVDAQRELVTLNPTMTIHRAFTVLCKDGVKRVALSVGEPAYDKVDVEQGEVGRP